jgi:hypothetical protein
VQAPNLPPSVKQQIDEAANIIRYEKKLLESSFIELLRIAEEYETMRSRVQELEKKSTLLESRNKGLEVYFFFYLYLEKKLESERIVALVFRTTDDSQVCVYATYRKYTRNTTKSKSSKQAQTASSSRNCQGNFFVSMTIIFLGGSTPGSTPNSTPRHAPGSQA